MPTFARGALPAIVDKCMASQSAKGVVKYCANQNATPVCSLQIFFSSNVSNTVAFLPNPEQNSIHK